MAEHFISRWLAKGRGILARGRDLLKDRSRADEGFSYQLESPRQRTLRVELRTPTGHAPKDRQDWCQERPWIDLPRSRDSDDRDSDERNDAELWFYAPGADLPDLDPAHPAALLAVASTEGVDALVLVPDDAPPETLCRRDLGTTVADLPRDCSLRPYTLFSAATFDHEPESDRVVPRSPAPRRPVVVKWVPAEDAIVVPGRHPGDDPRRRGPYHLDRDLTATHRARLHDPIVLPPWPWRDDDPPPLLVTTSFLARGGAEHTLFETLRALRHRFSPVIVTLAPHRATLGDRRPDFRDLDVPIFCLGDWIHPAAMPALLSALVTALGVETLYNANGTTLFYDFLPRLRCDHPGLRILDHLYDHRVGYIDRYGPALEGLVDACVAENHRIRQVLAEDHGWPEERSPVVWPCGRADDGFATEADRPAVRARLRQELGINDTTLLVLTAARVHPQKRPLDLVQLAERLRSRPVRFLWVGGGDLEAELDQAIAATADHPDGPAPIEHLGFRTDVPDLLLAADAGCLVSDYEGLPVFLLEALQLGKPFLGTDVGELGRVLRETEAGPVVDTPGDLEALVAAVERLLDEDQRAQFSERARQAGPRFSVAHCADRYARVFLGQALEPEAIGEPNR